MSADVAASALIGFGLALLHSWWERRRCRRLRERRSRYMVTDRAVRLGTTWDGKPPRGDA